MSVSSLSHRADVIYRRLIYFTRHLMLAVCVCVCVCVCVHVYVVYEDTNLYNDKGMTGITRRM